MGFDLLWILLYIIGSSLMTTWGANYGCCGCSFAAFFGFSVTILYICDLIIILYKRKAMINATSDNPEDAQINGTPPSAAWTTSNNTRF